MCSMTALIAAHLLLGRVALRFFMCEHWILRWSYLETSVRSRGYDKGTGRSGLRGFA